MWHVTPWRVRYSRVTVGKLVAIRSPARSLGSTTGLFSGHANSQPAAAHRQRHPRRNSRPVGDGLGKPPPPRPGRCPVMPRSIAPSAQEDRDVIRPQERDIDLRPRSRLRSSPAQTGHGCCDGTSARRRTAVPWPSRPAGPCWARRYVTDRSSSLLLVPNHEGTKLGTTALLRALRALEVHSFFERLAFSAMPEVPKRRASSASTSARSTPRHRQSTSVW